MGNIGWSWAEVLPYFKKSEHYLGDVTEYHNSKGELAVSPLVLPHAASEAFVKAGQKIGLPFNKDFNGPTQEGIGYLQFNIKHGLRQSTASAFLRRAEARPNLKVEVETHVARIVLDGKRAQGITYRRQGFENHANAREIIVAAGTINSPQILMLSGIGPADELQRLGIPVVHNLPGVGKNLSDHMYTHCLVRVPPLFSLNKLVLSSQRVLSG
jgi:choline dehydrogenase